MLGFKIPRYSAALKVGHCPAHHFSDLNHRLHRKEEVKKKKMDEQKSIAEVAPTIRAMVEAGIWDDEEEAVDEFKLRRERQRR